MSTTTDIAAISPSQSKYDYIPLIKSSLEGLNTGSAGLAAGKITFATGVPTLDENAIGFTAAAMATDTLEVTLPAEATSIVAVHASSPTLDFRYKWEPGSLASGKISLVLKVYTVATPPVGSGVAAASIPNHVLNLTVHYA